MYASSVLIPEPPSLGPPPHLAPSTDCDGGHALRRQYMLIRGDHRQYMLPMGDVQRCRFHLPAFPAPNVGSSLHRGNAR